MKWLAMMGARVIFVFVIGYEDVKWLTMIGTRVDPVFVVVL